MKLDQLLHSAKATALVAALSLGLSAAPAAEAPMPDSLDLPQAIQFAVENNFTIRQARERIKQQDGVILEVRARQIPRVAATGSYTGNDKELSTSVPALDRNWSMAIEVRQTLYAGGGVAASVRGAKASREAALLDLQGVVNEQLLRVRTQFYAVLLAKQRIAVQEENIRLLEEQLRTARNRFEAGASSNFEVLRAEVSLANGRPPLIEARNAYRIAVEELRQVMGVSAKASGDSAAVPEFIGSLEVTPTEMPALSDALSAARANRPELQRIAKLVDAGEQQVRAARSGYQPQLEAFGAYDWVRGGPTTAWNDRRDGWTAGVQAQWSIFDGRATAGKVAQSKSQLAQTRLTLDETALAIEVQVRRAHSSLQEAWEMVESTGKVVEQAVEALRLANARNDAGAATQLDVLTSQVALTEARLNQLKAYYSYHVAQASVRQATGQLDQLVAKN
jgi:outer membrane protein TolC